MPDDDERRFPGDGLAIPMREAKLLADLTAAKDAYRDDPSEETRERKATAVDAIRAYRIESRANRGGVVIGGDAVVAGGEG